MHEIVPLQHGFTVKPNLIQPFFALLPTFCYLVVANQVLFALYLLLCSFPTKAGIILSDCSSVKG